MQINKWQITEILKIALINIFWIIWKMREWISSVIGFF